MAHCEFKRGQRNKLVGWLDFDNDLERAQSCAQSQIDRRSFSQAFVNLAASFALSSHQASAQLFSSRRDLLVDGSFSFFFFLRQRRSRHRKAGDKAGEKFSPPNEGSATIEA